jgi:SAM-dependent methyltransferase
MQQTRKQIEASVKERFRCVALEPSAESKFPVGAASAKRLGYSEREIGSMPPVVAESFAGVGNPFSLGAVHPRETVLDLGCGAGFDSLIAASWVGRQGRVIGIDFSPEMIAKAVSNASLLGATNVEFRVADADRLPVPSDSVDLVLTNGVFNLCVDKAAVANEMFRVLKPKGRLQMADIVLEAHVTAEDVATKGEWSD